MRKIGLLVGRVGARPLALGVGVALVALALAWPATAANPAPGGATTPDTTPPPADEFGRGTPLGTARGFLEATALRNYHRATSYLNLRLLPQAEVATRGPELVLRDDGVPIWQFSNVTVSRIPDLYRDLSYGFVGERLPSFLVETRVMRLALWQWIGLAVLLGLSALIACLLVRPGLPLTRRIAVRAGFHVSDPTFGRALSPLRGLVGLIVFKAGESSLALPVSVQSLIIGIQKFVLVIIMA